MWIEQTSKKIVPKKENLILAKALRVHSLFIVVVAIVSRPYNHWMDLNYIQLRECAIALPWKSTKNSGSMYNEMMVPDSRCLSAHKFTCNRHDAGDKQKMEESLNKWTQSPYFIFCRVVVVDIVSPAIETI